MPSTLDTVKNIAFYQFTALDRLVERKVEYRDLCSRLQLRGTILLSAEGINGFLAGDDDKIQQFQHFISSQAEFKGIQFKESFSNQVPFVRLLVKIKKEIIPFGRPEVMPHQKTGTRLEALELKKWLDEKREFLLLDTRNTYEIDVGTFDQAVDMNLRHFRDFPEKLAALPAEAKSKPVVMFCTGGIRCEKATAYALQNGFENVFQLEGGILKYFEEVGGDHYHGDCFVFDGRLSVDSKLRQKGRGNSRRRTELGS